MPAAHLLLRRLLRRRLLRCVAMIWLDSSCRRLLAWPDQDDKALPLLGSLAKWSFGGRPLRCLLLRALQARLC
jgi:hypothetical protein